MRWHVLSNTTGSIILKSVVCQKEGHPFTPLANLRRPMPLSRKLVLVLSNNLTKFRRRQGCCGNYGQPGC